MVGAEIYQEIDQTLDQLIANAEAIVEISISDLSPLELQAFKNTQESLLQHFLYLDESLEKKREQLKTPQAKSSRSQIIEKVDRFELLKRKYQNEVQNALIKKSDILSKRRAKKVLLSK